MQLEKNEAVQKEDYERAKVLKSQIEEYRKNIYEELKIEDLIINDDSADNNNQGFQQEFTLRRSPFHSPRRPTPRLFLDTLREVDGGSQKTSSQKDDERKYVSNSHDDNHLSDSGERLDSPPVFINPVQRTKDPDERPLPTLLHKDRQISHEPVSVTEELDSISIDHSVEPTPRDEIVPNHHIGEEIEIEDSEMGPTLSTLTEQQMRQATVAIDMAGVPLVTKAYNKSWRFREEALIELEKRLSSDPLPVPSAIEGVENASPDPRGEMRSTVFLIQRALNDKVLAVFQRGADMIEPCLVHFGEKYHSNVPKSEIVHCVDRLITILIQRLSDTSPRIRNLAKEKIVTISKWPVMRHSNHLWQELVKLFNASALDRFALGRVDIVTEVYAAQGVHRDSDAQGGLSLDRTCRFAANALMHKSGEVRESAELLLLALYRAEDQRVVRHSLPPDDTKNRKNPLYKRLFTKFDQIDGKSKPPVSDRNHENEAVHADVQSLRSAVTKSKVNYSRSRQTPASSRQAGKSGLGQSPGRGRHGEGPSGDHATERAPSTVVDDELLLPGMDHTCIFCGEQSETFTEEGLDFHYWRNCLMLRRCPNCKQVVEISAYTEHLLKECQDGAIAYERCPRCSEAVLKGDLNAHVLASACKPCPNPAFRCPLCHLDLPVPVGHATAEDVWKAHLMGVPGSTSSFHGCAHNPRKPSANHRPSYKPSATPQSVNISGRKQSKVK